MATSKEMTINNINEEVEELLAVVGWLALPLHFSVAE